MDIWSADKNEKYYNKYNKFEVIEKNFNFNLTFFKKKLKKIKNYSQIFFRNNKDSYDIIYIDGGHKGNVFYQDANNAFNFLKKNGIIIFDDFLWHEYKIKNPISGIKQFIELKKKEIKIIFASNQLIIQKK